ncbi:MAG: hypothetical protein QNJ57_02965 [Flavobacteriaceae bacterium]|nr:hypothetical protein [Flavobacteriaceae bacterium]
MEASSFDSKLNKILLKPRFKLQYNENRGVVIEKFKNAFSNATEGFRGKIVGDHIVIDVTKDDEHLWSPQLQLELEESEEGLAIKGLFGPKPTLWSLFMFIHFGVALAFAVFATMLYTDISLGQDATFSMIMTIAMPIVWILFYLFGRWGKKKGHQQMVALYNVMNDILELKDT